MDQELKQRLIGAAVVTALAAIFIPMLFDDPVDGGARQVSEMTAPEPPADMRAEAAKPLPETAQDVLSNEPEAEFEPPADEPEKQAPSVADSEKESVSSEDELPAGDEQQWLEESTGEDESWQVVEGNGGEAEEAAETNQSSANEGARASAEPATSSKTEAKPKSPEQTKAPFKPAPAASKPPVEAKPKAVADNSKSSLSRWYVQAGSFSKKDNALALQEKLRKQGLPAFLETQSSGKGPIYRLKVGPELDKKRALAIKSKLSNQKINSIILAE